MSYDDNSVPHPSEGLAEGVRRQGRKGARDLDEGIAVGPAGGGEGGGGLIDRWIGTQDAHSFLE